MNNQNVKQFYIVVSYTLPYEILVNDLVVAKNTDNGLQGAENISLYFNNNIQKIKVRFFPDIGNNMKLIPATSLAKQSTAIFATENETDKRIKDLVLPTINQDLPFYEYEWDFVANAIDGIDNLNQSKDLTKIDKDELQKEVLGKYEELRKLLNDGEGKIFMKEIEKAKESFFIAENILKDEQGEYNINMEEYFDSHKGTIPSIKDFTIKIMGNSRAISLENNSDHKGLGILSSEDVPNNTLNVNYIILHKPAGSDKFEIFRYNCTYMALK